LEKVGHTFAPWTTQRGKHFGHAFEYIAGVPPCQVCTSGAAGRFKKESHHWWANSLLQGDSWRGRKKRAKGRHCRLAPVLSAQLRLGSHKQIEEQIVLALDIISHDDKLQARFRSKTEANQQNLLALRPINTTRRNIHKIGNDAETMSRRANFRTHAKSCERTASRRSAGRGEQRSQNVLMSSAH